MKYSSWALVAMLAGVTLLGCQRKDPSETHPDVYDPEIGKAVSMIDLQPDPNLLADQNAISRRMERSIPAGTAEEAPLAPQEAAPEESAVETEPEATTEEAVEEPVEEHLEGPEDQPQMSPDPFGPPPEPQQPETSAGRTVNTILNPFGRESN